jgi:hypothetical protein
MVSSPDELRTQAHRLFRLTNQLKVQLQVLEETPRSFSVQVQPLASSPDGDIEAMAFTVLIRASKSAQEDLRTVMEQLKDINEAKRKLRETRTEGLDLDGVLQLMAVVYVNESDAQLRQLQDDLDSMSELGEVESLRLQMAMDRLSKMISTLSNVLKKLSDTSSAVIQNLK